MPAGVLAVAADYLQADSSNPEVTDPLWKEQPSHDPST